MPNPWATSGAGHNSSTGSGGSTRAGLPTVQPRYGRSAWRLIDLPQPRQAARIWLHSSTTSVGTNLSGLGGRMAKSQAKSGNIDYTGRAFHQDATDAMRGDIVRGLIEFVTNSDDAYASMRGPKAGKIVVEVEHRRNQPW